MLDFSGTGDLGASEVSTNSTTTAGSGILLEASKLSKDSKPSSSNAVELYVVLDGAFAGGGDSGLTIC